MPILRIRVLNVVDEFTRVALGTHFAASIGAREVLRQLEVIEQLIVDPGSASQCLGA